MRAVPALGVALSEAHKPDDGSLWSAAQASALLLERTHSPRDLREAISVTAKGDGQQIEIQLGHMCNNVCTFCVSGQLTQDRMAKRIALEPVLGVLEEASARGVKRVTILGGEPTIQPSFLPALTRAVELGFSEIVIFTNLVRGREPRFLEQVCGMGRFTWRISIQGGNAETHDQVVGRQGAFDKIEQGLAWLGAHGQDLTANACINEDSYRSAPDYVDLVRRYGIRQLHLDMVRPGSIGVRTPEERAHLLARYADIAGPLGVMLDRFDAWNPAFEVNLGNLPHCVLPRHAHRIAHGGEETLTVTTDDKGNLGRVWDKYEYQSADKVHGPRCGDCVFRPHCRGVSLAYAQLHGTDELQPVSEPQARALDPRVGRWLDTGWRPGRDPLDGREPADARSTRVHKLAGRVSRGGPYAGWAVSKVQRRSERAVDITLRRAEVSLAVHIEATPGDRRPVKVSFTLPEGVEQTALRPPVEAVSRVLRG